jgi:hypothetical protein
MYQPGIFPSQITLKLSYTASIQMQSSYHLCCIEANQQTNNINISGAATIPKTGETEKPYE